jgi:phosphopantothenoylcysteine decarboxylase/phosphopantothenate--cysteine ligase
MVGFAAETDDLLNHARQKLIDKNLDLIVANDILAKGAGFEGDTNVVTLLDRDGTHEQLSLLPKREIADIILDRVAKIDG